MVAGPRPYGILRVNRAHAASRLISKTEQIVIHLGPAGVDLKLAEEGLAAAKKLYQARHYADAAAQAEHAGVVAIRLNERFNAYMAAWKELESCMAGLRDIGLATDVQEAALDAADKEVVHLVKEDGGVVPNYIGATLLLGQAAEAAHRLVDRARVASREIFLATLAVEALAQPCATAIHGSLALLLERVIEHASRELALGHVSTAYKIASAARARADAALAATARVKACLEDTRATLGRLEAEGPAAEAVKERVESAQEALHRGFVDGASMIAATRHMSDEVAEFADRYTKTRGLLENSQRVYERLQQQGFNSDDVITTFDEARRALDAGNWTGVREQVSQVSTAINQLRDQRAVLAMAIADIDDRVAQLEGRHLALAPEVRETLGRAKEELEGCRLVDASQDVLRANELVEQAARTSP